MVTTPNKTSAVYCFCFEGSYPGLELRTWVQDFVVFQPLCNHTHSIPVPKVPTAKSTESGCSCLKGHARTTRQAIATTLSRLKSLTLRATCLQASLFGCCANPIKAIFYCFCPWPGAGLDVSKVHGEGEPGCLSVVCSRTGMVTGKRHEQDRTTMTTATACRRQRLRKFQLLHP